MIKAMKVFVISLGCPKNLTDTEVLMGSFCHSGHTITSNIKEAEIILINTCAFIKEARDESFKTIREALKYKIKKPRRRPFRAAGEGAKAPSTRVCSRCKFVYVAGCLPALQKDKVLAIKGIDGIIETTKNNLFDHKTLRIKATPTHTAYIKIADGCNNRCSYCSIPRIRGHLRSRPIPDIIKETAFLAKQGVSEIIYVAQDTTVYGLDLYGKPKFAELLQKTSKIPGIRWIRIMYAHPNHVDDELIELIAREPKIVKYLDLPIQHICDKILKFMRRKIAGQQIKNLIHKIRRRIPEITLRTSLMVGFPGETESDFNELLGFVKEAKFERLGVFKYSKENGTSAAKLKGKAAVPSSVVNKRFHALMRVQNQISKENNKRLVGKMLEVLIEKPNKGGFLGRSYMDAPEIDGSVHIKSKKRLLPGEMVRAKVIGTSAYDLLAAAAP
jgi:ribosomal protein S12 methylthiotransferase